MRNSQGFVGYPNIESLFCLVKCLKQTAHSYSVLYCASKRIRSVSTRTRSNKKKGTGTFIDGDLATYRVNMLHARCFWCWDALRLPKHTFLIELGTIRSNTKHLHCINISFFMFRFVLTICASQCNYHFIFMIDYAVLHHAIHHHIVVLQ